MAVRQLLAVMMLTVLVVTVASTEVRAADDVFTTTATGGQLKIDANGTYSVEAGWTLVNVTLYARKTGVGGQTSYVAATAANNTWSGTLSLTAGTYNEWATITTIKMGVTRTKTETPGISNITVTP